MSLWSRTYSSSPGFSPIFQFATSQPNAWMSYKHLKFHIHETKHLHFLPKSATALVFPMPISDKSKMHFCIWKCEFFEPQAYTCIYTHICFLNMLFTHHLRTFAHPGPSEAMFFAQTSAYLTPPLLGGLYSKSPKWGFPWTNLNF